MSVDANRMGSLIRRDAGATGPAGAAEGPAVPRSGEIEEQPVVEGLSGASALNAPRNWAWLSQSVEKLQTLCRREASLTSHSRETLRWESLANRLQEVKGKLSGALPTVELGSLRHPPREGEEAAHHQATELVKSTAQVVAEASQAAAEGGQKAPRGILELCGKILLGILATVGSAVGTSLIPIAGPQLAIASVILGVLAVATVALAHVEHNRHALEFQELDDFLAELNTAVMKQDEHDGATASV
jgi:hypothetical protein